MGEPLHLRYLEEVVWAPGGPLLASLAEALRPQPLEPSPSLRRRSPAERRARIEARIERWIHRLDRFDGDPDLEPEPLEDSHDGEPDDDGI